ncbi:DNA-processing protein DprA [Nocardia sp. CA-128927]|uniref:DNA-processing protein DprA n=1 Tax=Nocardia sp. CA-128927 TaxID=3239975 RepID=UPI003D9575F1
MSDERQLMWAILARAALTAPRQVRSLISQVGPEQAAEMLTTRGTLIDIRSDLRDAARRDLDRSAASDGYLMTPDDPSWPARRLADLDTEHLDTTAPIALWTQGSSRVELFAHNTIGIVGARAATDYGRRVSAEIAGELADRGWTIASGGAFGVDAEAHRAALAHGGTTIAVLPTGLDRPHPHAHTDLFAEIAATGLLLSQYPPRTELARSQFLARNRLVAALSRAVVIPESGLLGGTRNTVRWATKLARPVFAVPGPIHSAASAGCHAMIRDGEAELITSTAQILDSLTPPADLTVGSSASPSSTC